MASSTDKVKHKFRYRDFEYVVKKQEPARICFGSGQERFKASSRWNRFAPENIATISPDKYNLDVSGALYNLLNKPRSMKGPIACCAVRHTFICSTNPAPCAYNLPESFKQGFQNKYPFNSSSKLTKIDVKNLPGPGSYNPQDSRKLRIPFHHSFGKRRILKPAVDIKCIPIQADTCKRCGNTPLGDYWHTSNKAFLCRSCMLTERKEHTFFNKFQLETFRKIRDCSFMHCHDGTRAAVNLLKNQELQKLRFKETYLDIFFS